VPKIGKGNQVATGTHAGRVSKTALNCLREVSRIWKYCAHLIANKNDCSTTRASRETQRTLITTTCAARCLQIPDWLSDLHARCVASRLKLSHPGQVNVSREYERLFHLFSPRFFALTRKTT